MPELKPLQKVLVANRGEIAVRVIRACKDAGIGSVAVYADPDRDAVFARLADEAHSLGGATPADSYLDIAKIIKIAADAGADSVHPGYGFLAENAGFAQAVIDAGLTWIGPPPAAIESLGDKVKARHIAEKVGAPLVAGTKDPVEDADEVVAFAKENGLPIAIKAAFGGGGRGLKVARTMDEVAELYDSAVREAVTAFGRGECFVEKYLDKPRHVETQCLADQHGNVVVVSTRDCSLQRRHQKLVEEAPAPFLTDDQVSRLYASSKAILREAGYVGAGTCEFLVGQDGTISFLEVNTRLQVEHPVSEEVTGLDLVREMFRIAAGEELGYDDPQVVGHSIEYRINAEDGGRNFMPAPGTLTAWAPPGGPGVRVDGGYEAGETVPGSFDSLVAKLIVTGRDRTQALERSRRALDEFVVDGMPTVIPFHRAVVDDPAYVGDGRTFGVYTSWIETEFDNQIEPYAGDGAEAEEAAERQRVTVEVGGKRLEVVLPGGLGGLATGPAAGAKKPKRKAGGKAGAAASGDAVTSPMQGTIVKVAVEEGQTLAEGDVVVVLEAMKMEQPLKAHKAGTVTGLDAEVGATVDQRRRHLRAEGLRGQPLLPIRELVRVARQLDGDHHWPTADQAAARWGRDGTVFVRSSATHVFVAGDLVLRMAPVGTPQADAVSRSATTAETLFALGAPVPAPVPSLAGLLVEDVDGMVVTALRRVPGRTYDDDELTANLARLWGGTLARFHEVGYVHGDPEPDNLVVDDGDAKSRATFVDLDDAARGDPVADIAFALRAWTPPGGSPDLAHVVPATFLEGYAEVREIDLTGLPDAARVVARRTLASYELHLATPADPDWPAWAINLHARIAELAEPLRSAVQQP